MKNFFVLFFIVFIAFKPLNVLASDRSITQESLNLYDKSRNRNIPVEIYVGNQKNNDHAIHRVIIINHGYGVSNKEYSFIAKRLAESGYFVASIQHDLKDDPKLRVTGDIKDVSQCGIGGFKISDLLSQSLKSLIPLLTLKKSFS